MLKFLTLLVISHWQLISGLFMPLEDSLLLNKYSINYVSPQIWEDSIANNKSLLDQGSVEQLGDDMLCFLPVSNNTNRVDDTLERNETALNILLEDNLEKGVNIISEVLNNSCITYPNGFWSYSYCPGDKLTQYHGNPGSEQFLIYTLGRSPSNFEDRKFQLLYNEFGYYISEILDDGQSCEVTNLPRMTELQYVCGHANGPATFQWTRETKTCKYEAHIAVPALCELELLAMSDDKNMAKAVICRRDEVKSQQTSTDSHGVVDMLTRYDPLFMGYGFYLLDPKEISSSESKTDGKRSLLMYSGDVKIGINLEDIHGEIYQKASKAMSRMMFMKFLLLPDSKKFNKGDSFMWMTDVVDLNGSFISRILFDVDELSMINIEMNRDFIFPKSGNFIEYKRKGEDLVTIKVKSTILKANNPSQLKNDTSIKEKPIKNQAEYSNIDKDLTNKSELDRENKIVLNDKKQERHSFNRERKDEAKTPEASKQEKTKDKVVNTGSYLDIIDDISTTNYEIEKISNTNKPLSELTGKPSEDAGHNKSGEEDYEEGNKEDMTNKMPHDEL